MRRRGITFLIATLFCFGVCSNAFAQDAIGDLNCDGLINRADITPFISALQSDSLEADVNQDGVANFSDITALTDLFTFSLGDANRDGAVDNADFSLLINILSFGAPYDRQFDFDGDGDVDGDDANSFFVVLSKN